MKRTITISLSVALSALFFINHAIADDTLAGVGINKKYQEIGYFTTFQSEGWDGKWTFENGSITFDATNEKWNVELENKVIHTSSFMVLNSDREREIESEKIIKIIFNNSELVAHFNDGSTMGGSKYLNVYPFKTKDGELVVCLMRYQWRQGKWKETSRYYYYPQQ